MSERFVRSRAERFDRLYPFFPSMREAFRAKANDILDGRVDIGSSSSRRIGIELEFSCIQEDGEPLPESVRNKIVSENKGYQKELGASQIEIMTQPIDIEAPGSLTALRDTVRHATRHLDSNLSAVQARTVRMGADPNVFLDDRGRTQTENRYRIVPDFHDRHRREGLPSRIGVGAGQVRCDQATAVGAMSSIQFNLDCHSIDEALRITNRSLVTGPYSVAMGANARFLDGTDTGIADIRNIIWDLSHDIRTYGEAARGLSGRTGLPVNYYHNLQEYFEDIHDQPSIVNKPESAFNAGIGLYWRDTRIKFIRLGETDPRIVVEFRPLSVQPTTNEDVAMLAFAIGHIFGAEKADIPLLPFERLHDNRWSAMLFGTRGKLWSWRENDFIRMPAIDALRLQFPLAVQGLASLGATRDEIAEVHEVWDDRLTDGCPSEVAFHYVQKRWMGRAVGSVPINRELLREFILSGEV